MDTGKTVHECGGGRMKCGAAEAAEDQHRGQHPNAGRQSDQRQHRHRDERAADQQDPWIRSVGDVAEAKLRHGVGQLKAHLQGSGAGQRQIQIGDEQWQQRGQDVAVSINEEMRAGENDDRSVQTERAEVVYARRRNLLSTICMPSLNSRRRNSHAARASTARAAPISAATCTICHPNVCDGSTVASHRSVIMATAPIAADATAIRTAVDVNRDSFRPPRCRRSSTNNVVALNSAAIEVPSARPRYPITLTRFQLRMALTITVTMLTTTGMRFKPSA